MKKILIIWFASLLVAACNKNLIQEPIQGNGNVVSRNELTGHYNQIGVRGPFDVEIIHGNTGEITVTADENLFEYFDIYVKSNKLIIGINDNYRLTGFNTLKIKVPITNPKSLSIAGSGKITGHAVQTDDIKLSVAGSGVINLAGQTNKLDINIAGSGNINTSDLIARHIDVNIAGSGITSVYPLQGLDIKMVGSGLVNYYHKPEKITIKKVGSGKVIYMSQ